MLPFLSFLIESVRCNMIEMLERYDFEITVLRSPKAEVPNQLHSSDQRATNSSTVHQAAFIATVTVYCSKGVHKGGLFAPISYGKDIKIQIIYLSLVSYLYLIQIYKSIKIQICRMGHVLVVFACVCLQTDSFVI